MQEHEVLSEDECWRLLGTASVGRVALSMRALPAILPVQFYLDGRTIALCLGSFQVPADSGHGVVIAFSADDIDVPRRSGWSVQAVGIGTFDYQAAGAATDCGEPRAGQLVCFEPRALSGQRLHLCPFLAGKMLPLADDG